MKPLFNVSTAMLLLAMSFPVTAQEDIHPELTAKYSLDMGVFYPERSLAFGAGATAPGDGTIDFGGQFGLDRKDELLEIDFQWRFGEKWSLSAQHFQVSGERSAFLEENLEWNNVVFSRGTNAQASTDFTLYRLFFARSLTDGGKTDFGLGAGLHWLEIGAGIEGSILVNNTVVFSRESVKASSPLPNIGAWYSYSLSPRWVIKARGDWFGASIDEYDGSLVNFQAGINFALFKHGGIGVAYNFVELDVDVDNNLWNGSANLTYEGPFAFISVYW